MIQETFTTTFIHLLIHEEIRGESRIFNIQRFLWQISLIFDPWLSSMSPVSHLTKSVWDNKIKEAAIN